MVAPYCPDRQDLIWIDFEPQSGREITKYRPALVLSPASYNGKVGLAILCPITSQEKGYPFEVKIPAGLGVTGVILADQAKSMDWRVRQAEYIAQLPVRIHQQVLAKLTVLLEVQG